MSRRLPRVCRRGGGQFARDSARAARRRRLGVAAVAVAVLGWGCTGGGEPSSNAGVSVGDVAEAAGAEAAAPPSTAALVEPTVPVVLLPGEGVGVSVGVGVRSSDLLRAEVLRLLLGELGYVVSDPAGLVTRANLAYLYLAEGEFDVWVGARMPTDEAWLAGERFDGSSVGSSVRVLGGSSPAVQVFGWLISKAFADEHGVYTLDALDGDPAALAAFDAADAVPGNGRAEILSWPALGTADQVVASQIAFSGWDNVVQFNVGYIERLETAVEAAGRGAPVVVAAADPSRLVTQLRPGAEMYWLGVESILDDSNPLGLHQGELHSQFTRGLDGAGGYAPLSAEVCPSAAEPPQGMCPLGWVAEELRVAANADFAASNPAATALLDAVTMPAADISQALVREAEGTDPAALASEWIAANRALVDVWLTAARAAA